MKFQVKQFIQVAFGVALILSLSALVAQAQEDGRPRLRVVNASLGIPNADVYVNNTLYFSNVFYSYISNYVPVDQTSLKLRVRPAGVKDADPITEREWNFEGGKDYTMVIVGSSENIETPLVFEDNNKGELRPGQARVRLLHVARDAPALEVCLNNQCNTLTYPKVSDEYITLDAGTYKLSIRLIGTDEVYFDMLPIAFEAGQVYSIFLVDPVQGEIKPRIIPHIDTGRLLPQPPGDIGHPPPYSPGEPGPPPAYPPVTGAFLSPTALLILIAAIILMLGGGFWLVKN